MVIYEYDVFIDFASAVYFMSYQTIKVHYSRKVQFQSTNTRIMWSDTKVLFVFKELSS